MNDPCGTPLVILALMIGCSLFGRSVYDLSRYFLIFLGKNHRRHFVEKLGEVYVGSSCDSCSVLIQCLMIRMAIEQNAC